MRSPGLFSTAFLAALAVVATALPARAGGGPENCMVIVNPESWASLTVANHFIHDRNIPDGNVVFLPFKMPRQDDTTDVETFREKLLKPVLTAIKERGLEKQIDLVAWSSDFPTAIDCTSDMPAKKGNAIASINGLTFLCQQVLAKDSAGYLALDANRYYRPEKPAGKDSAGKPAFDVAPPLAFSSQVAWGADDKPAAEGRRYLLSIVLGVTSGRGNSVREVTDGLARAASADDTHPKGAFYFSVNGNVRSTTRQWGFSSAIAKLKTLGLNAQTNTDTFPQHKDDVMGAMLGLIFPKQEDAGSKTLPGAIVENLTSEGGTMSWSGGQTPISDFIRHGAAGSSGTVAEPYAIQAKFPSPFIFYHYASGATLAEAFYESVHGPYQLLIVGDPLCQPYAAPPKISAVNPGKGGEGRLAFDVTLDKESPHPAGFQAFVDGKLVETTAAAHLQINAGALADGYHELSVEAIAAGAIEPRGRIIVPLSIPGKGRKIELSANEKTVIYGKTIQLTVAAAGADSIAILHAGRPIAIVRGDQGQVAIDSHLVGMGPVRLQAVATFGGARVASEPIEIDVKPDQPLPAAKLEIPPGEVLLDGPTLTSKSIAAPHIVLDMRRRPALQEAKVPAAAPYAIDAFFDAAKDDLYQFQIWTDGATAVKIDDTQIGTTTQPGWTFLPVTLSAGKHHLLVTGTAGPTRELSIRFGGPGSRDIGKRAHTFDAENVALHFAHMGNPPPPPPPPPPAPAAPAK